MKQIATSVFFLLMISFMAFVCFAESSDSSEDLWQKAVDISRKNVQWVPGYLHTSVVIKDKKGEILESEKSEIRFYIDDSGEVQNEIVSMNEHATASDSSRNETSSDTKKQDEDKESEEFGFNINPSDSVFNADIQDRVAVKQLNRKKKFGNATAVAYEFVYKTEEGITRRGTAWLHETTGLPFCKEYTVDPLPKHTREMLTRVTYSTENSAWYPLEIELTGVGGFLWIKRQFEMHLTFSRFFVNRNDQ